MAFPSSSCSKVLVSIQIAFAFVGLCCNLDLVHGLSTKPTVIDSGFLTQKIRTNRSIVVDRNGNGDFKSIQDAINSVPDGNSNWIIIHVRKGTYREKVRVTRNKPYIFMRGSGQGKTLIVWSNSSHNNLESATFKVEAQKFVAFGIRFKNDAPIEIADTSQNQSVAAVVGADKVAFYHCSFLSSRNTLFDYKGRHYYDHCYIQGSIDFIFGRARSIFHDCEIFVVGDKRMDIHGSIAAHHREKAEENTGFVFQNGKVYGVGQRVYLGRAKGAFSRVIFTNTYLSNAIEIQGWTNWSYAGDTKDLYLGEYKCSGPGSNTKSRAPWSKQMTDKEVAGYLSVDFIDGKEWLPAWIDNEKLGVADKASTK